MGAGDWGEVEKHSGFAGEVGGGDPEDQLSKEPNPGQLVGVCQETEKSKCEIWALASP